MTLQYEVQNNYNKDIAKYVTEQVRAHKYETGSEFFEADGDPKGYQDLNVYLRDTDSSLIGALTGATFFGAYAIRWLWVHDNYRHQGYAREMLKRGIQVAIKRGCTFAYGDTWETQGAHTLYDKLGAEVIMRMENFPQGSALTRYKIDFAEVSFIDNPQRNGG